MFVRTVKAKGETYVRIVEGYRKDGKPKQKVIANLGNLRLCQKELVKIIEGLRSLVSEVFVKEDEIEPQNGLEYGCVMVGEKIFKELGLEQMLRERFRTTKALEVGGVYALAMTMNRLSYPSSKLGIFRWMEDTYLPDWPLKREASKEEQKILAERFYRTLDYLERWKDDLEQQLYFNLRNLFSLKVDLVFYDLTSTYFEGEGPKEAKRGRSRDGHPRDKQIMIGLVLCQGLPIAHYVFEGNRLDKTTVKEVVKDLKARFEIGRFVFVGDRGLVTKEIIQFLEDEKLDYIVALRRRRCLETARAIEVEFKDSDEKVGDTWFKEIVGADEVAEKEWGLAAQPGRRLFICLNQERKEKETKKRQEKMDRVRLELEALERSVKKAKTIDEKEIASRVTRILSHHNGNRYFAYEIKDKEFIFYEHPKNIPYEKKLDGKFVLLAKTVAHPLSEKEVVKGYKDLWDIEWAFRDLKDFVEIRPIYHRKENRVRGHVQIVVWALLIERIIQRKLDEAGIEISARMALSSLRRIKAVETKVGSKQICFVTLAKGDNISILKALGISKIPKVLTVS